MVTSAVSGVHQTENLVFFVLMQLAIIILTARLAGNLARKWGQSRAVGEIIVGLMLGPSLLGHLFPDISSYVFHSIPTMPLSVMSQIGLVLLMFQIGMDFDFSHLKEKQNRTAVVSISAACIALPFALGYGIGVLSAPYLAPDIAPLPYSLFVGTALSITAVPILGRIMMEFGLTKTRIGAIVISAAAINDVVGWTLLAIITSFSLSQFSLTESLLQVGWIMLYVAVSWFVVRPILIWIMSKFNLNTSRMPQNLLGIILAFIFVSGMFTYKIGIFAIFGGFILGVLLHDQQKFVTLWKSSIGDFVIVFFLPIFFTFAGLRTNIGGLNTSSLWLWFGALVAAAIIGKILGSYIAARLAKLDHQESLSIGVLMNTRALMELIVINIGYEHGFIPQNVYTMLVLVAIITTVMTSPWLRSLLPRIGHAIPVGVDA
jgi:Kef-type K+ transport system membrane component KefB